jgi:multiple sugar transport system ATP-binding protein
LAKAPAAEKNARVEAAAAILGLTDLLSRFPRQLSGGQRQRVAMGRAIVRNPKVFLFDEPLSNLDAKMRVEMRKEIRLTNTMIYVTHDQVEAMTLGDRICVMKGGVMQQIGTPSEVFDDPANLFVAGFIGTPPMNLMPGRIAAVDGGAEFHGEGFSAPIPKDMLKAIPGLTGRNVMLGLRSKALSLAGPSSRVIWRGMRTVTEMLGEEALVHLALGGSKVVMNVEPHALDGIGKEIGLEPQMNRAHFFDADSGENLTAGIELPGRRSVRR